jgi:hypothetical protein
MSTTDDEEPAPSYHGPYGLRYFEGWRGMLAPEGCSDVATLVADLARWRDLIQRGEGSLAAREIDEILIQFAQPSPVQKILEANRRAIAAIE